MINCIETHAKGHSKYEFDARFNGRRRRKTIDCLASEVNREYSRWCEEMEMAAAAGTGTHKRSLFETIQEYVEFHRPLVGTILMQSTFDEKVRSLNRLHKAMGNMKLCRLKRPHIAEYKQKRYSGGASASTVNLDIAYICHFMNWCRDRDYYIGNNPAERMKDVNDNRRVIQLSREQTDELLLKAEGSVFTAVALAIHAGLRKQEILGLQWSDIDFKQNQIWIRPETSKGSKGRIVPLTEDLKEHLQQLYRENPYIGRVFAEWNSDYSFRKNWELLRDKLSFRKLPDGKDIVFHDLRHCYGVKLRQHGVDLGRIAVYMGHTSVKVTERYYANVPVLETARDDMAILNNVVPLKSGKQGQVACQNGHENSQVAKAK